MGEAVKDQELLKESVNKMIQKLENGEYVYLSSGYIRHDKLDKLLDSNAHRIVSKLTSLGYEHTTNHGHGCYDWKFFKEIEL
jgi:hypothetical protein